MGNLFNLGVPAKSEKRTGPLGFWRCSCRESPPVKSKLCQEEVYIYIFSPSGVEFFQAKISGESNIHRIGMSGPWAWELRRPPRPVHAVGVLHPAAPRADPSAQTAASARQGPARCQGPRRGPEDRPGQAPSSPGSEHARARFLIPHPHPSLFFS